MARAIELAAEVRHSTSPNPWVGAVVVTPEGDVVEGSTQPPGGHHAERVALEAARVQGCDARLLQNLEAGIFRHLLGDVQICQAAARGGRRLDRAR